MFGISRAPEIKRAGQHWFNVEAPLSLADLKGRLVILDFWTFCCINCVHVLPTLARIEAAYPDEVAVIGIHSPKFSHERDPETVRQAIARYDVRHPVVHDPDMVLWREYCVRAWPTLVLISPDGFIIGQLSGEPHPDLLVQGIGDMLREFWARGEMKPRKFAVEPLNEDGGALRFPGKIKPCPATDGGKMWALADTGHHQIVLLDDDGCELVRYGDGTAGWRDGGVEASFNAPEGLACDLDHIYVADTRNHVIRRIDRATGITDTIAGIGCRGAILRHPEPADGCALASPWDLELQDHQLYFANAGSHQIGILDLDERMVRPVAGNGGENIVDGMADDALLAQPSGLALADGSLYFADSETSALRRVALDRQRVETLVGAGLFEFGHANGPLDQARLQHPLGVAAVDGRVYVADSYNSAIRVVDLAAGTVADLPPLRCADLVCRPHAEPAGIAADGPDRLLVSDTNNHRIVEILLDQGLTRTWLE
ncbi:MAG TPA: thioredoxin-like domain-containing protein [Candidatus Omnitrophota bacterium]|nr:thioredoxin-like domain-containing protein [Candidatus Omnitrophota bacterium]